MEDEGVMGGCSSGGLSEAGPLAIQKIERALFFEKPDFIVGPSFEAMAFAGGINDVRLDQECPFPLIELPGHPLEVALMVCGDLNYSPRNQNPAQVCQELILDQPPTVVAGFGPGIGIKEMEGMERSIPEAVVEKTGGFFSEEADIGQSTLPRPFFDREDIGSGEFQADKQPVGMVCGPFEEITPFSAADLELDRPLFAEEPEPIDRLGWEILWKQNSGIGWQRLFHDLLIIPGQCQENFFEIGIFLLCQGTQFLTGSESGQMPMREDSDPVTDFLSQVQAVGRQKEGCLVFTRQVEEQVFDQARRAWIQPDHRLIHNQVAWVMQQGGAEDNLLAHAMGIAFDGLVGLFCEAEEAEVVVDLPVEKAAIHLIDFTDKAQVLPPGELFIKEGGIGNIPDLFAHLPAVVANIQGLALISIQDSSGSRPQQSHHHPQGRGFPGAIRPQKTTYFTGLNFQGKPIDSDFTAEVSGQLVDSDHRFRFPGSVRESCRSGR